MICVQSILLVLEFRLYQMVCIADIEQRYERSQEHGEYIPVCKMKDFHFRALFYGIVNRRQISVSADDLYEYSFCIINSYNTYDKIDEVNRNDSDVRDSTNSQEYQGCLFGHIDDRWQDQRRHSEAREGHVK